MAFKVPKSKASIKQNRYEFEIDGKVYDVPLMKYLPVGVAEKMEEGGGLPAILSAFGDGAAADAVRGLDGDQLEALTDDWAKESGIEMGESSDS